MLSMFNKSAPLQFAEFYNLKLSLFSNIKTIDIGIAKPYFPKTSLKKSQTLSSAAVMPGTLWFNSFNTEVLKSSFPC